MKRHLDYKGYPKITYKNNIIRAYKVKKDIGLAHFIHREYKNAGGKMSFNKIIGKK